MPGQLVATEGLRSVLAGAYGSAVGGSGEPPRVGTEHLLLGLAVPAGGGLAAQLLDRAELTMTVVMSMLRQRAGHGGWQIDESNGGPAAVWARYGRGKPVDYTGPALAALHHAEAAAAAQGRAEIDSEQVLDGLLAAEDNRAGELLRGCGVDPARLRDQLRAGLPDRPVADDTEAVGEDGSGLPSQLWRTRDVLLGRAGYRTSRLSRWLRVFGLSLAEAPAIWVELDARDRAAGEGRRRPGTEDLLLSVLAIHETLDRYPHLRPERSEYLGGQVLLEVLAEAGLDSHAVREAASRYLDQLGTDSRRARSQRWRIRAEPRGTGELLLAVLTQDDCRAANLLRRTGVAPARVRDQLTARLAGR